MVKKQYLIAAYLNIIIFATHSMQQKENISNVPAKLVIQTSDEKQLEVNKEVLLTSRLYSNMLSDQLLTLQGAQTPTPVNLTADVMNILLPLMAYIPAAKYNELLQDLQKQDYSHLTTIIISANQLDIPELLGLAQITYNKKLQEDINKIKVIPSVPIDLLFPDESSIEPTIESSFTKKLRLSPSKKMVTVICDDGASIDIDTSVLQLSTTINNLLQDTQFNDFNLPEFDSKTMQLAFSLMTNLLASNISKIIEDLNKLDCGILNKIIMCINYLDIEELLTIALKVYARKLAAIGEEEGLKDSLLNPAGFPGDGRPRLAQSILNIAKAPEFYETNFVKRTQVIKSKLTSSPLIQQRFLMNSDNSLVALCSENTVQLKDIKAGTTLTLTGHTDTINALCFSPDGNWLATGSNDLTARLWDVKTGICKHILQGHKGRITSLCFSSDSCLLATGSQDKTACVWSIKTGINRAVYTGHTQELTCVSFSPNGSLLATASLDGTIRINSFNKFEDYCWKILHCSSLIGYADWLCFSADGFTLIISHASKSLYAFDISAIQLAGCLDHPTLEQALLLHLLYKAVKNKGQLRLIFETTSNNNLLADCNLLKLPCLKNLLQNVQIVAESVNENQSNKRKDPS